MIKQIINSTTGLKFGALFYRDLEISKSNVENF